MRPNANQVVTRSTHARKNQKTFQRTKVARIGLIAAPAEPQGSGALIGAVGPKHSADQGSYLAKRVSLRSNNNRMSTTATSGQVDAKRLTQMYFDRPSVAELDFSRARRGSEMKIQEMQVVSSSGTSRRSDVAPTQPKSKSVFQKPTIAATG